jgi:hypothetical protein
MIIRRETMEATGLLDEGYFIISTTSTIASTPKSGVGRPGTFRQAT